MSNFSEYFLFKCQTVEISFMLTKAKKTREITTVFMFLLANCGAYFLEVGWCSVRVMKC